MQRKYWARIGRRRLARRHQYIAGRCVIHRHQIQQLNSAQGPVSCSEQRGATKIFHHRSGYDFAVFSGAAETRVCI